MVLLDMQPPLPGDGKYSSCYQRGHAAGGVPRQLGVTEGPSVQVASSCVRRECATEPSFHQGSPARSTCLRAIRLSEETSESSVSMQVWSAARRCISPIAERTLAAL